MTQAQRWFTELSRAWADRPKAPPADWLPPAPKWLEHAPGLRPIRAGADLLWQEGKPAWGWVLMANSKLWEAGWDPSPGEVLWCEDPFVERFPQWLGFVSEGYWHLKRGETSAAGLRALTGFAQDEHRGFTRARFPPLLSHGRVVWHATMLFYREHLPCKRLVDPWLPIVRVPGGTPPIVMTPPLEMWPRGMKDVWVRSGSS